MEKKKKDINFIAFILLFFILEKLFLSFCAYFLSLSFKNAKEFFGSFSKNGLIDEVYRR